MKQNVLGLEFYHQQSRQGNMSLFPLLYGEGGHQEECVSEHDLQKKSYRLSNTMTQSCSLGRPHPDTHHPFCCLKSLAYNSRGNCMLLFMLWIFVIFHPTWPRYFLKNTNVSTCRHCYKHARLSVEEKPSGSKRRTNLTNGSHQIYPWANWQFYLYVRTTTRIRIFEVLVMLEENSRDRQSQ